MEPPRDERQASGQRQRPVTPGEDKVSSPASGSFHISTIPTTWGRKRRYLGSIPPGKVWKLQPNWLIVYWLRLKEPVRDERWLSGQRRSPATHGQDKFPSPNHKTFHVSKPLITWRRKRESPASIPSRTVWNPKPHWRVAD